MVVYLLERARHPFQVFRLQLAPFPLFLNPHLEPLESHV